MHNELLPVVDEHDRVIDTLPRHYVHAQALRHRAVHILVFDDQDRLFLQKRSLLKDLNAGLWDTSAAGHVDAGENYDNCALRELEEELGIKVDGELESLFKLPATAAIGMEFIRVYRCRHNGPFTLAPEEIETGDWFSEQELFARIAADDRALTETFKTIWRHYRS